MEPWLTYKEAADKLGVSPQAVRQKAIRGRWSRTKGNDGQARVQVPEQPYRVRTPSGQVPDVSLVTALESHIKTLQGENEATKEQLAEARARLAAADARLAAAETRLEKQAAELTDRTTQHAADLVAERATTEKAIAAFASLADRLDALAAERAKPWWRRLKG